MNEEEMRYRVSVVAKSTLQIVVQARSSEEAEIFADEIDFEKWSIVSAQWETVDVSKDFISQAFIEGEFKTAGTAITKLLPAKNMFSPGYEHSMQKSLVIQKLKAFFERFSNL